MKRALLALLALLALSGADAAAQSRDADLAPYYGAVVVTTVGDLHSTRRGLATGQLAEGNPVLAEFDSPTRDAVSVGITAFGVLGARNWIYPKNPTAAKVVVGAIAVGRGLAWWSNERQIRRVAGPPAPAPLAPRAKVAFSISF
jgi:hypothetical protein